MASVDEIKTMLVKAGVRPSIQRIAVARYIAEHRTHPTVDDVYTALLPEYPTLSRTTVYNTARLLVNSGDLKAIVVDGDGMRLDIETASHAHFVCRCCRRIFDLPLPAPPEAPRGYAVEAMNLSFSGICPSCGALS